LHAEVNGHYNVQGTVQLDIVDHSRIKYRLCILGHDAFPARQIGQVYFAVAKLRAPTARASGPGIEIAQIGIAPSFPNDVEVEGTYPIHKLLLTKIPVNDRVLYSLPGVGSDHTREMRPYASRRLCSGSVGSASGICSTPRA
jgi:hypothetical protein